MSDSVVLRERLALGDRTFTVLAEPWYDAASDEWKGRYLYVRSTVRSRRPLRLLR